MLASLLSLAMCLNEIFTFYSAQVANNVKNVASAGWMNKFLAFKNNVAILFIFLLILTILIMSSSRYSDAVE